MKCDNCGKNDFPVLSALELFGQTWLVCTPCITSLFFDLKNSLAFIVPPRGNNKKRAPKGSLIWHIEQAAEMFRKQSGSAA